MLQACTAAKSAMLDIPTGNKELTGFQRLPVEVGNLTSNYLSQETRRNSQRQQCLRTEAGRKEAVSLLETTFGTYKEHGQASTGEV